VEQVAKLALSSAAFPKWFPRDFNISYDPEGQILIVEHSLPNLDEIEWVKLVVLKNSRPLKPLTATERKKVFAEFYPLVTLSLAVLMAKHFDAEKVALIAVNGWVEFRSKATGLEKSAFCSSLAASSAKLKEIDLQHADPLTAYHALKGVTTPSLELAPVAPKLRLDMEDKRFVEARDVLQGMNSDENLASMDWEDFEHLCRELFEKVFASEGATVSVTQASRDQGVDAIILDPDPIRGGKIVIQAKRYVNTVDVSAVRDLWGVVSHEGAMKGLLVTTSQFGPDSYAFAQGKPLTLINGSELLHLLEKNGYTFRINLEEARQMQRESGMPPFRKKR
jgi:restriction system protein